MVLGGYPQELLDTYQDEREPHVRFITEKAIELGRVQTMRDPEDARRRDAQMIAARRAEPETGQTDLPAIVGRADLEATASCSPRNVSSPERTALLDDVVGSGWLMIVDGAPALSGVPAEDREAFARIGGQEVSLGLASMFEPADLSDTGGTYAKWFAATGCIAAIVRPDSYIYGLAHDPQELAALTKELLTQLSVPA